MKILHTKRLKDGRCRLLIEIDKDESIPVEGVQEDSYYRLSYPHDDEILPGHVLRPTRVYWNSIEQRWRDA